MICRLPDGQLVTPEGFTVAPGISVPQDAIGVSINRQGVVVHGHDSIGEI